MYAVCIPTPAANIWLAWQKLSNFLILAQKTLTFSPSRASNEFHLRLLRINIIVFMPSTKHTHAHTYTYKVCVYIAYIEYGSGTLASCSAAAQSLQLVKVFEPQLKPQLKSQLTAMPQLTSTLASNLWQLQSAEIRHAKKCLARAKPRYASQGCAGRHTPQHFIFLWIPCIGGMCEYSGRVCAQMVKR